jgi:hypothetical protein
MAAEEAEVRDLWEMAAVLDFFNLFRYGGQGAGGGAQDFCGQGSGKSGRQLNLLTLVCCDFL